MKKFFKKIFPSRESWIGACIGFLISIPIMLIFMLAESTSSARNMQLAWIQFPLFAEVIEYQRVIPINTTSNYFIIIFFILLIINIIGVLQFIIYGYFLGKSIPQKKFSITLLKIIAIHFSVFFLGLAILKPYWINRLYGYIPIISKNITFKK